MASLSGLEIEPGDQVEWIDKEAQVDPGEEHGEEAWRGVPIVFEAVNRHLEKAQENVSEISHKHDGCACGDQRGGISVGDHDAGQDVVKAHFKEVRSLSVVEKNMGELIDVVGELDEIKLIVVHFQLLAGVVGVVLGVPSVAAHKRVQVSTPKKGKVVPHCEEDVDHESEGALPDVPGLGVAGSGPKSELGLREKLVTNHFGGDLNELGGHEDGHLGPEENVKEVGVRAKAVRVVVLEELVLLIDGETLIERVEDDR